MAKRKPKDLSEVSTLLAASGDEIERIIADRLARITPDEAIDLVRGDGSALVDLAQQVRLAHAEGVLQAAAAVQRQYDPANTPSVEEITTQVLDARWEIATKE